LSCLEEQNLIGAFGGQPVGMTEPAEPPPTMMKSYTLGVSLLFLRF